MLEEEDDLRWECFRNIQFDQKWIVGNLKHLSPTNLTQIWIFDTKMVIHAICVDTSAFNQVHST
jgi:hypothetical protein